nr:MAG TPA: hypothetical protein [Caudoviricetes sp.]
MNNDIFNHLMERLLSKADDALNTYQKDKSNEFYSGRVEAYYEVLDALKSELTVWDYDLDQCGLDFDLDKKYLA